MIDRIWELIVHKYCGCTIIERLTRTGNFHGKNTRSLMFVVLAKNISEPNM